MNRRPPKRCCPSCGGDHYSWTEHTICKRCYQQRIKEIENRQGPTLRELRQANQQRLRSERSSTQW